jgi:hypothetical protein
MHTKKTQAQVIFFALACPNLELAFITGAAYSTQAILLSGSVVSFDALNRYVGVLQYLSVFKYSYAAVLLHLFQDNPRAVTELGTVEQLLHILKIDSPSTVWACLLASLAFYLAFLVGGMACLEHMYKEIR